MKIERKIQGSYDEFDHNYDSTAAVSQSLGREIALCSANRRFGGINLQAKVLRAGRTSLARKLPLRHLRTEIDSR